MSNVFSAPKAPKLPPPVATPTALDPLVSQAAEARRKKLQAAAGRQGTILTGLGGAQQTLGMA